MVPKMKEIQNVAQKLSRGQEAAAGGGGGGAGGGGVRTGIPGWLKNLIYCQVSNIRRTLVGNKIVNRSDVVGAMPVGAAPTTSSFST